MGMISAEVEPVSGKARKAASLLQDIGFTVLHVGPTISVEGPESLWESTFNVSFESAQKTTIRQIDERKTYQKALTDEMRLPENLQDLVKEVTFPEPPEFY